MYIATRKKGREMKIVQAQVKPITQIDGEEALMLIQRVAKTCYKTHKDTDDFGSAIRIAKQLMASGHHSMFEFYNITMKYRSNIAAYKDLRTHRHSTFAVESTRWCNYSKGKFGNEIAFLDPIEIPKDDIKYQVWLNGCQQAEQNYMDMMSMGATPDQASLLLPQSTAAEFNVCANIREWRHIFALRAVGTTGQPRPCVQQIMIPTLQLFARKIPVLFDDLLEQLNQKAR